MYGEYSRYRHSSVFRSDKNELYIELRPRIDYAGGEDEILHKVVQGDTLHNLAARYLSALPAAANLWWAIADFQPEPINDPTVALTPGTWLVIPSVDLVQSWLMAMSDGQGGAV